MNMHASEQHSSELKAEVVAAAERALAEVAHRFGVDPALVDKWRRTAADESAAGRPGQQPGRDEIDPIFRGITEHSPVVMWMTDASGSCTYLNRAWYEFTGMSPGASLGSGWLDALHPDDRATAAELFAKARETASPFQLDYRLRRSDGVYRWAVDTAAPWLDEAGRFLGYVGSVLDISDRRDVEDRLRESESRYRTLFESIDQGFSITEVLFDEHGKPVDSLFLETNHVLERMTGLQQSAGKTLSELVPEVDPFWVRTSAEVARSGEPVRLEHYSELADRWFDIYIVRLGGDGSNRVASLVGDISNRKRAEQALRESERNLRQLADAMPQIVWIARADGYHEYFNRRWFDYSGVGMAHSEGAKWTELLHPDDYDRTVNSWQHSLETGEPYQIEYRFRQADGCYRWFLGRALPVRNESGDIVRWFGTCTEIEDLKRAQTALREADQRKDEFLATLGHELRNPLASLTLAVEMLDRPGTDDAKAAQLRELARRQVSNLGRLVDDLLDVSRITRGKVVLEHQHVDLRGIVEAARQDLQVRYGAKRQTVAVRLPPDPVEVVGDPMRLEQVIANLLTNAAKYTDPEGRIDVILERVGSRATLCVRDNGIGLAPEAISHVFDLFGQVEHGLDRAHGGLGIGLTVVKSLVELHGGTVRAHSDGMGKGSEFVVELPLAPACRTDPSGEAEYRTGRQR